MITSDDTERLQDIHDEMVELLEEFRRTVNRSDDNLTKQRFKSYAYGNIVMQLNNDHDILGKSPFTLQDIIDELAAKATTVEGDEEDNEETEDEATEVV